MDILPFLLIVSWLKWLTYPKITVLERYNDASASVLFS